MFYRDERLKLGLTLHDLATKAGISSNRYEKIELGLRLASRAEFAALDRIFHAPKKRRSAAGKGSLYCLGCGKRISAKWHIIELETIPIDQCPRVRFKYCVECVKSGKAWEER